MDLQADTVAQTMAKVGSVPSLSNQLTSEYISFMNGQTRADATNSPALGRQHDVVDLPKTCIGLAEQNGAGQVGMVSIHTCAHINDDWSPLTDRFVARLSVRQSTMRTSRYDNWERDRLSPRRTHGNFKHPGHFTLRCLRRQLFDDGRQGVISQCNRMAQASKLALIFRFA